ncbi:ScbA/BarX family gamma-butyrolactone biosynthesis protein [Streptomyces sp. NBC_00986]|uniref:ScbA/BarX family gamma-butyrolactone biosynthesis protein n=1 Tax=Streptomyces sp. NBC_00986 TaxID=2903702 RepID=UPI00386C311C|nr:hypothetical protein OG504_00535 [Streptomyces sp. NBC_00986]WSX64464.1 hypothetical protein OG504_52215 [Streptomyces sp. NBC_00986]
MNLTTTESGRETRDLPRLTTTVPKEYVHRASLAEVFLTDCTARGGLGFTLTGQWPRAHTYFTSPDGTRHDPLQVAETFRQAGIFLAHTELDVPLGHHFVMWALSYTTDPHGLRIGPRPTDFTITAHYTELVQRRHTINRATIDLTLHRDNTPIAHGTATFSTISPSVYTRLRGNTPTPTTTTDTDTDTTDADTTDTRTRATTGITTTGPATPTPPTPAIPLHAWAAGTPTTPHTVLTPTPHPHRWLLTPNLNHPTLFDHTGDHIPGMVLLEAARQAAHHATNNPAYTPTSATTTFTRYTEFDHPCHIDITHITPNNHTTTIHITGHQNNHTVFTSTLTGPTPPTTNTTPQ